MSRTTTRRLERLEAAGPDADPVPVFCRGPDDFEAAFAQKVKWGFCKEEDRARALPYDHPIFEQKRTAHLEEWNRWLDSGPQPSGPEFGKFVEWLEVLD